MNIETLIEQSKEIVNKAVVDYDPYAVLVAVSGGDDSLTAYHLTKYLGIPIDGILHINTQTGIEETTIFVRNLADKENVSYFEGDAGTAYDEYILRKGFFGRGLKAHSYAYHILKKTVITKVLATIRQRKRNRKILIINGARITESDNRAKNFAGRIYREDNSNVWVNIIHYWTKSHCLEFLSGCSGICRNPVSIQLCRSGECMCGTMQSIQSRHEAAALYPDWGKRMDERERQVLERFPWGWGQNIPSSFALEQKGQLRLFDYDLQPLCSSCLNEE